MTSTISATTQNIQQFDWYNFFSNPIVLAIISSGVIIAVFTFILKYVFKLGARDTQINTALTDITELKNGIKKLVSQMDRIIGHLATKTGLDASLMGNSSPVKLLPAGIALLDKSGFKQIYSKNKTWFLDEIKKYKVETLGDIDEASFKLMEKRREYKEFADFKELAFQNGVNLDVLLRVLSIYLRDELAKEILKNDKRDIKKEKS